MKKVLDKLVSPTLDSVKYTFAYCTEGHDILYGDTYGNGTESISYPYGTSMTGFPFNLVPEQFTRSFSRSYIALQHIVPGLPAVGHAWDNYNCCWTLNPDFNINNSDEEYTAGLGRVFSSFLVSIPAGSFYDYQWEKLVYFKKGSVQWGTQLLYRSKAGGISRRSGWSSSILQASRYFQPGFQVQRTSGSGDPWLRESTCSGSPPQAESNLLQNN